MQARALLFVLFIFPFIFFTKTACLELVQHLFNNLYWYLFRFWPCGTVKLDFWDCTIPQSQKWWPSGTQKVQNKIN
jgi:hypothetical protein